MLLIAFITFSLKGGITQISRDNFHSTLLQLKHEMCLMCCFWVKVQSHSLNQIKIIYKVSKHTFCPCCSLNHMEIHQYRCCPCILSLPLIQSHGDSIYMSMLSIHLMVWMSSSFFLHTYFFCSGKWRVWKYNLSLMQNKKRRH